MHQGELKSVTDWEMRSNDNTLFIGDGKYEERNRLGNALKRQLSYGVCLG